MQLTRKPKQNGETQAHEGTCGNRHGGKQQASKKSNKRARSTSPMSAAEGQCIDVLANLHQSTKPCKQNTSVVGTLNGGTRCTVSWAHAVICNCGSERPSTRSRFATSWSQLFGAIAARSDAGGTQHVCGNSNGRSHCFRGLCSEHTSM